MMEQANPHKGPGVECRVSSRPISGQDVSGDAFVCQPFPGGTLVAAIDGLGHGPEAAEASRAAKAVLEQNAGDTLLSLVKKCDAALKRTRGVVASLARFDVAEGTLSWIGVGNVEGVFVHECEAGRYEKENMFLRGGVIGYMMPSLKVTTFELEAGDILVLATDGLRGAFADSIECGADIGKMATDLLSDYGKLDDDALVIVARYTG